MRYRISYSAMMVFTAQLRGKLYEQQTRLSPDDSSRLLLSNHNRHPSSSSAPEQHALDSLGNQLGSGISLPHASLAMANLMPADNPNSRFQNENGSPQMATKGSDPFMDLLFSGWNPDLPDPPLLNHLFVFVSHSAHFNIPHMCLQHRCILQM